MRRILRSGHGDRPRAERTQVQKLQARALSRLAAGELPAAGEALSALGALISASPDVTGPIMRAFEQVERKAEEAGPKAEPVVRHAVWGQIVACERIGRYEHALELLSGLLERGRVGTGFRSEWRQEADLTRIRLLYFVGRFQEANLAARDYVSDNATATRSVRGLVEALWFGRFAAEKSDPPGISDDTDSVRQQLAASPVTEVRLHAARGSEMVIWRSLLAQDVAAVFEVVGDLEHAFEQESDNAAELELGDILVGLTDYFLTSLGAFLESDLIERSLIISRMVGNRFQHGESADELRLLAAAKWTEYRALGALNRPTELEPVAEQLAGLGSATAEVLEKLKATHRDDATEPQTRMYSLSLIAMRAAALSTAPGRREDAVVSLDAALAQYRDDESPLVQQYLDGLRTLREGILGP